MNIEDKITEKLIELDEKITQVRQELAEKPSRNEMILAFDAQMKTVLQIA